VEYNDTNYTEQSHDFACTIWRDTPPQEPTGTTCPDHFSQDIIAIAKKTVRCAQYTGALKSF